MANHHNPPEVKNLYLRRRLHLFKSKFKRENGGKWNQNDWADLWGYSNVSTVSRVFSGQLKLKDDKIIKTCEKAKIDPDIFHVSILELALALGLPSPYAFPPNLHASTIQQFPDCPSSYKMRQI